MTNAELLLTPFLLEHNIALPVSGHAENLFQAVFPDFKVAQKYVWVRNKNNMLQGDREKNNNNWYFARSALILKVDDTLRSNLSTYQL